VSVNEALRTVRRRWRIVVLCLLVGLLGAGAATFLTPRQYSSDVTLYVSLKGRADSSDAAYQASQLAKERVVSYAPLLKDERITQPVIDKLQLGITAQQLADRITVTVQPETVVLSAAVTDTSPQRAADIANALADEFVGLVQDLEQPFGPAPPAATPGQSSAQPTKIGVTVIRPATAVLTPISPNIPFNLALGTALGLLAGIAAAFVREARDTRVRSTERLRAIVGAPLLAEIPTDRDSRLHPLTLGASSGSARVEAFRKLRTNLQFPEHGHPHRVVVVTSAAVGEGKTTTACNLALALADSGSRVLLVDLNLRRPEVDRYVEMHAGAGAVNVLGGRIAFSRAVQRWVDGRMDVLPAGPSPLNGSEILTSRGTDALFDEVRRKYDFVIIDTPAVLPVTDAAVVAARADGVVLVVRYGRTAEELVADAVNALDAVGTRLLGVVVSRTPAPRRRRRVRSSGSYPEPQVAPELQRPLAQAGPAGPPRIVNDAPPTAPLQITNPAPAAPPRPADPGPAGRPANAPASAEAAPGDPARTTEVIADAESAPDDHPDPVDQLANGGPGRPSPSPRG
jgi:succinoglycan biosynthesis transport protein ExoP